MDWIGLDWIGLDSIRFDSIRFDSIRFDLTMAVDVDWFQRETLFAVWLRKVKADDVTTVTATEIVQLGELACGATATNIDQLPLDVYK